MQKRFAVQAVCGVGMAEKSSAPKLEAEIAAKCGLAPERVFYLQGGYDIKKLRGMYKFMMASMTKGMLKKLESKPEKSAEELAMIEMSRNGRDCVSEENLAAVLAWTQTL